MKHNIRRNLSAWALLSVFVPMVLLSALHLHNDTHAKGNSCVECVKHSHHHSHLSLGEGVFHDCILCQFLTLTYFAAAAVTLLLWTSSYSRPAILPTSALPSAPVRQCAARAPPFLLL
ncbi:MAG: hypothetical protein K5778_10940 [Bacteroidaceae bacterium]|nr:hypothetical protein [Bacteroidaceae bacterium]